MSTATKTRKAPRTRQTPEERKAANAARWQMLATLAETMALAVEVDEMTAEQVVQVQEATGCSERNAMLIVGQCRVATVARSFKAWKEHGRQVRKGEKALYILAPTAKRNAQDEEAQQAPEEPKEPETPAPEGEGQAKPSRRFVVVPVFDVSQTDPIQEDGAEK